MPFKPCINRNACTEDGTHCHACGRSHEEIAQLRSLVNQTYALISRWGYDNQEEFFGYLQKKIGKKLKHTKEQHTQGANHK